MTERSRRLSPADQIAEVEDEGGGDVVADGGARALCRDEPGVAEDAEVLGGVGLFEAAGTVDFANAQRALAQTIQNAQPDGVGERVKKFGHAGQLARIGLAHAKCSDYCITHG